MRRETPEPWAAAVTGSQPKAKHSRSDARGANQDGPPPGHNSTHRVCEPSPRAALMPDLHRGEPWCKPQCLPHQRIHVRGATAAANRASMVLQPSKSGVPPARSSLGGGRRIRPRSRQIQPRGETGRGGPLTALPAAERTSVALLKQRRVRGMGRRGFTATAQVPLGSPARSDAGGLLAF